jgi:hypothetical protein
MRTSTVVAAIIPWLLHVTGTPLAPSDGSSLYPTESNSIQTDELAVLGLAKLAAYVVEHGYPDHDCTLQNVAIRREW